MKELIAGLQRFRAAQRRGMVDGLQRLCNTLSDAMQNDPAHGDVTGASHANYAAIPVGEGADTAATVQSMVAVVEELNPGHSETGTVNIPDIGAIITSATDYQWELETQYAGRKAVIGPTLQGSATDFTRYAAEGAKVAR